MRWQAPARCRLEECSTPISVNPSDLEPVLAKDSRLLVAAFYAFTPLDDERREALLTRLPNLAREGSVLGSVLVAH